MDIISAAIDHPEKACKRNAPDDVALFQDGSSESCRYTDSKGDNEEYLIIRNLSMSGSKTMLQLL